MSAATERQNAAYRVYGPEQDVHLARLTVLDDIIGNPRRLHAVTLYTAEQFDYILHRYTACIKEHEDTTLFWDDNIRASDPGNRSRLYIRYSLLLSLMRKKGGTTQAELAAMFGVDQSNINRSLEASNRVLSEVLPTARRMTQIVREADTLTDLKRIIPPDLGMLTRIMSKYDTPEPDRPALYVDKGYQGISNTIPRHHTAAG